MKNALIPFACCATLFAETTTIPANIDNISKIDQIIDVRTPEEWAETGIIKGAKTITLTTNKDIFLKQIKENVDTTKPFALICRSGHRSSLATKLLDSPEFKIINLEGGMNKIIQEGYKTTPYEE